MTPFEFVSWLRGFAEAVAGAPSESQWTSIKAALDKVPQTGQHIAMLPTIFPQWQGSKTAKDPTLPPYEITCGHNDFSRAS